MLLVEKLSKTYKIKSSDAVKALDNVSLRIAPGDFVAARGPSGCGKSTLLLACGTMLTPDDGDIQINETHPYKLSNNDRARFRASNIGFVFQRFHLVPYLNALENILLPTLSMVVPDAETKALELAERFGVSERILHKASELSVGERQRVALARALLHSPKLLLADEPTGNLDPESAKIVVDAIKGFAENGGMALMVTHDPSASAKAHREIVMKEGKIL